MKIKNNAQETADNQVRRTFLRNSAILLSVLFLSLTVNAQDLWEQFLNNNTAGRMALLEVENSTEAKTPSATLKAGNADASLGLNISFKTFVCETEQEKELLPEPWMTAETYFSYAAFFTEVETEEALKLEEWMFSKDNFIRPSVTEPADSENPSEIEAWMTDDHLWGF